MPSNVRSFGHALTPGARSRFIFNGMRYQAFALAPSLLGCESKKPTADQPAVQPRTNSATFRDQKDLRFGLGMSATHIGDPARRDRLLLLTAIAHADDRRPLLVAAADDVVEHVGRAAVARQTTEAALERGHRLLPEQIGERCGEGREAHGEARSERRLGEVVRDQGLAETTAALEQHVSSRSTKSRAIRRSTRSRSSFSGWSHSKRSMVCLSCANGGTRTPTRLSTAS